jgi:hypothetical protein
VTEWIHPQSGEKYNINLVDANRMSAVDMRACFKLIEETSRADYEKSTSKWRPENKAKEMKSAGMRYIMVKSAGGVVRGFTSLMPTVELGSRVVYCYEIHLKPDMRG